MNLRKDHYRFFEPSCLITRPTRELLTGPRFRRVALGLPACLPAAKRCSSGGLDLEVRAAVVLGAAAWTAARCPSDCVQGIANRLMSFASARVLCCSPPS